MRIITITLILLAVFTGTSATAEAGCIGLKFINATGVDIHVNIGGKQANKLESYLSPFGYKAIAKDGGSACFKLGLRLSKTIWVSNSNGRDEALVFHPNAANIGDEIKDVKEASFVLDEEGGGVLLLKGKPVVVGGPDWTKLGPG